MGVYPSLLRLVGTPNHGASNWRKLRQCFLLGMPHQLPGKVLGKTLPPLHCCNKTFDSGYRMHKGVALGVALGRGSTSGRCLGRGSLQAYCLGWFQPQDVA